MVSILDSAGLQRRLEAVRERQDLDVLKLLLADATTCDHNAAPSVVALRLAAETLLLVSTYDLILSTSGRFRLDSLTSCIEIPDFSDDFEDDFADDCAPAGLSVLVAKVLQNKRVDCTPGQFGPLLATLNFLGASDDVLDGNAPCSTRARKPLPAFKNVEQS